MGKNVSRASRALGELEGIYRRRGSQPLDKMNGSAVPMSSVARSALEGHHDQRVMRELHPTLGSYHSDPSMYISISERAAFKTICDLASWKERQMMRVDLKEMMRRAALYTLVPESNGQSGRLGRVGKDGDPEESSMETNRDMLGALRDQRWKQDLDQWHRKWTTVRQGVSVDLRKAIDDNLEQSRNRGREVLDRISTPPPTTTTTSDVHQVSLTREVLEYLVLDEDGISELNNERIQAVLIDLSVHPFSEPIPSFQDEEFRLLLNSVNAQGGTSEDSRVIETSRAIAGLSYRLQREHMSLSATARSLPSFEELGDSASSGREISMHSPDLDDTGGQCLFSSEALNEDVLPIWPEEERGMYGARKEQDSLTFDFKLPEFTDQDISEMMEGL